MTVRTTAGTTLKISASNPATFDAAGYAALAFTTVGEVTNLAEFGREYNIVTHNPIANRGTVKKKGSFNEGQISLELGVDDADAGQTLMRQALNSDNDYSFLITSQSGRKYYFQAQVASYKFNAGGVDQIFSATANLEITTAADGTGIVIV
jgi:hypothetical protein